MEATVSGILKGIKALWNYAWFVMEVEKGQTLWLSDCPVVLNNDEKGIYAGLGFAAPGIQIYMPMTPELILVCWHPVVAGRFITEQKTTRDLLGRLRAQFLLGTKPNKAELKSIIAKLEAAAKPIDRVVSAIKSRGLVQATADNVLHLNWQQFQWSHRFILSREDDFSLVARMLEEHPDLKTGMRMGDGFANAQ